MSELFSHLGVFNKLSGEAEMDVLRVLIVEDEPLVSIQLEEIIEETVPAVVVVKRSAHEARKQINDPFDFAILDVDVTNGKTYEIARLLNGKRVPYILVSGSVRDELPPELQNVPFVAKLTRLQRSEMHS